MPQPGRPAEELRSIVETTHPDVRSRTLKHGETFAVFNAYGDIEPAAGVQGIYHEGTRFLSLWRLTIADRRPLYLSSTVREDNAILTVDLMNPELPDRAIARGQLHIFRAQLLWQGVYYERIRITHYGLHPVRVALTFHFDADFRDVFEVRGHPRTHRGMLFPVQANGATVTFGYRGRDGRIRRTRITWDPPPQALSTHVARFEIELYPRMVWTGYVTVATTEARYNPMSYHNGSVWPHDNALIAWGFARYRLKEHVLKVLTGMFDAAIFMDLHRLPELFCGFDRRPGEGPTLYPVACNPQAWAAAAVFLLLRAALGLTVEGATHRVIFDYPVLPPFLQEVYLRRLRVGTGSVDLLLRRHDEDVTVRVLHREGPLEITIIK